MDFRAQIKQSIQTQHTGLEFGPSFNPIAPKAEGYNVVVVDHATRDELVAKYEGEPVEHKRIETVDIVWRGQDLREQLGCGTFDYIIASHVIEHVPCLISFLMLCQDLLKKDGKLYLLVPDKRFCFDTFRPVTSLGSVLDAYYEKRIRPSPSQVFDAMNYSAKCLGSPNWNVNTPRGFTIEENLMASFATYKASQADQVYRDVHCWVFVPSSFRLIIAELHGLGFISFGEVEFNNTEGCEFYACLSASAPKSTISRKDMLENINDEVGYYSRKSLMQRRSVVGTLRAVLVAGLAHFPRIKLAIKSMLRRVRSL